MRVSDYERNKRTFCITASRARSWSTALLVGNMKMIAGVNTSTASEANAVSSTIG